MIFKTSWKNRVLEFRSSGLVLVVPGSTWLNWKHNVSVSLKDSGVGVLVERTRFGSTCSALQVPLSSMIE
jgi:hypothetical protein